jgi:S-DNA-T family DNA segregation ATPase FtsK/SpoIIIE
MGRRVESSPIRVRWDAVRISLWALILGWLVKTVVKIMITIVRSPVALVVLTLAAVTFIGYDEAGLGPVLIGYGLALLGLAWLRWRHPAPFERWVFLVLRSRWRRWSNYRYRWPASMDTAGLNRVRAGVQYLPTLKTVRCTRSVDRVRLRLLPGQTVEDWAKVSDRLCQTFGAQDCRVRSLPGRPHELELWFLIADPLVEPVAPLPADQPVDLDALPVGLGEDGSIYRLRLRGNHVLIVGATGAGKGSVLWSIIDQLAPAVRAGLVQLWALDPKGGMELAFGSPLFERFEHRTEVDFAAVLEEAVQVMRRRQQVLRGVTRLHEPSTAEPLIVVMIDELAALTGYVGDRETKRRIANALGLLLSQGRAVGVVVVAAVQDPRKDTIPARDLFPVRVALRLTEAEQVHLVMGHGARDRGARCDAIPECLPGIAFVVVDGIAEPVRVRFCHITDQHIGDLISAPAPPIALPRAANPEPVKDAA